MLSPKEWTMSGEISSRERPLNSLLSIPLDWDGATKAIPVITQEDTLSLEDLIKKRIKEKSFDDVIKKTIVEKKYKPKIELDSEKSKLGLGEVYEKEYESKVLGVDKENKLEIQHKEIQSLFDRLSSKLDSLSHFNFVPKQMKQDVRVIPNVAAIQMEEVLPVSVSQSRVLAPEEIFSKERKELKGESEITSQERKKSRGEFKQQKRKEKKQKEIENKQKQQPKRPSIQEALQTISKNRNTKVVSKNDVVESTTGSTALFKQLQSEMAKTIKSKSVDQEIDNDTSNNNNNKNNSSKFKL